MSIPEYNMTAFTSSLKDIKLQIKEPESEIELLRPKRCQMTECRQKIKLTDSACKCKSFFCTAHRHSELHNCTFDYRQTAAARLEKQLIKTQADKLERIE
uniref:AN1-type domain-containing protein n=1 Tax=viral metagenome TaxID=1070528 RepID=A0A6C0LNP4_9ZZZZ